MVAADAKLNFDDNAAFRQKEIFAMRDTTQEDPREVCLYELQQKDDCYYKSDLDSLRHRTLALEHKPSYILQVLLGVPI